MLTIIYLESHDYKLCSESHLMLRIWTQNLCERALLDLEGALLGFIEAHLHSLLKDGVAMAPLDPLAPTSLNVPPNEKFCPAQQEY